MNGWTGHCKSLSRRPYIASSRRSCSWIVVAVALTHQARWQSVDVRVSKDGGARSGRGSQLEDPSGLPLGPLWRRRAEGATLDPQCDLGPSGPRASLAASCATSRRREMMDHLAEVEDQVVPMIAQVSVPCVYCRSAIDSASFAYTSSLRQLVSAICPGCARRVTISVKTWQRWTAGRSRSRT